MVPRLVSRHIEVLWFEALLRHLLLQRQIVESCKVLTLLEIL